MPLGFRFYALSGVGVIQMCRREQLEHLCVRRRYKNTKFYLKGAAVVKGNLLMTKCSVPNKPKEVFCGCQTPTVSHDQVSEIRAV